MDIIATISNEIDRATKHWFDMPASAQHFSSHELDKSDVRRLAKSYEKRLRHLAAMKGAPLSVIQNEVHLIAKSGGARLTATVRAYDGLANADPAIVLDTARHLSLDHFAHEKVKVRLEKSKTKSGDHRMIALTGVKRRAAQIIMRDLALAYYGDSTIDGAVKGAGGERGTISKIVQAIQNNKVVYWTSLDVKSFFPSLKPGHFDRMILPKRWVRRIAFLPEEAELVVIDKEKGVGLKMGNLKSPGEDDVEAFLSSYGSSSSKLKKVQQGMIAGDAIAPLFARWFLGRELQLVLKEYGVVWFTHCDDLAIGSRTEEELSKAIEALNYRLQSHPAGPLETYGGEINYIGTGFEFLNYFIRRDRAKVRVTPGIKRFARLRERLWSRLLLADQAGRNSASELGLVTDEYFASWFVSQTAWTKIPNSFAYAKAEANRVLNLFMLRLYEDGAEYLNDFIDFEEASNAAVQWPTLAYPPDGICSQLQ